MLAGGYNCKVQPRLKQGNSVAAPCPGCGGEPTTFEPVPSASCSRTVEGGWNEHCILLKCSVCGRGAACLLIEAPVGGTKDLREFWPKVPVHARVPADVPDDINAELRESEQCIGVGALRAAAALLRSTLEKVLKANGYDQATLVSKIEAASKDGVLTEARMNRANALVRVLGNDVLHEEWREVMVEEVSSAHHYVVRVLEDFYDDRPTVETLLIQKGRRLEKHAPDEGVVEA